MDAGLAAVAGALIGLAGSPIAVFVTRRFDRADRRRERNAQLQDRQRDALQGISEALGALLVLNGRTPERVAASTRLHQAVIALDLVADGDEGTVLVQAARAMAVRIISTVGTDAAAVALIDEVSGTWLDCSLLWRRRRMTAAEVLARVTSVGTTPTPLPEGTAAD